MDFRGSVFENLAGDLEYHPRRAALYMFLGIAAASFWLLSPPERKFTTTPLTFALGSLTLFLKGIFLLRKTSEGLGLTDAEWSALSDSANRKPLPGIPALAAQIVQDFGAGPMLLWPLLKMGRDIDQSWANPPQALVFLCGAVLFGLGWVIRRFVRTS